MVVKQISTIVSVGFLRMIFVCLTHHYWLISEEGITRLLMEGLQNDIKKKIRGFLLLVNSVFYSFLSVAFHSLL